MSVRGNVRRGSVRRESVSRRIVLGEVPVGEVPTYFGIKLVKNPVMYQNWANFMYKKSWKWCLWHVNVHSTDQNIMQKRGPRNWILKVFKCGNEMDQRIELWLSYLLLELRLLKCQKWLNFYIFCWWQQKTSHSLGNIFQHIWKTLFSFFRKCCGLLVSIHWQNINLWTYRISVFLLTQYFFMFLPKEPNKVCHVHTNILAKLWLIFCFNQQKIQRMSHF